MFTVLGNEGASSLMSYERMICHHKIFILNSFNEQNQESKLYTLARGYNWWWIGPDLRKRAEGPQVWSLSGEGSTAIVFWTDSPILVHILF